jgi:hypothetical protein
MSTLEFLQVNPKRVDTKSYERYEAYKAATSLEEMLSLGGTRADYKHDRKKGFIRLEGEADFAPRDDKPARPAAGPAPTNWQKLAKPCSDHMSDDDVDSRGEEVEGASEGEEGRDAESEGEELRADVLRIRSLIDDRDEAWARAYRSAEAATTRPREAPATRLHETATKRPREAESGESEGEAAPAPDGRRRRPRRPKKTSSRFYGVCWAPEMRKWRSQYYNASASQTYLIGFYKDEEAAARAYNDVVREKGLRSKVNEVDARARKGGLQCTLSSSV